MAFVSDKDATAAWPVTTKSAEAPLLWVQCSEQQS